MKYIDYLVEQFIKANGISKYDVNSRDFLREFSEWVQEMQIRGNAYLNILDEMGIDVDTYSTAEVGKTSFDSICKPLSSTIITPYTYGFDHDERLIRSNLSVDLMGHAHVSDKKTILPFIKNFMTYNPYNAQSINNWDKLHNKGNNIVIGVFGRINDKDMIQKIMLVEYIKELLDDDVIEEETTVNDTYCKIIASDRKILKKIKSK